MRGFGAPPLPQPLPHEGGGALRLGFSSFPQYPANLWRRETAAVCGLTPRAGRPTVVSWGSPTPRRRLAGCLARLRSGPKRARTPYDFGGLLGRISIRDGSDRDGKVSSSITSCAMSSGWIFQASASLGVWSLKYVATLPGMM